MRHTIILVYCVLKWLISSCRTIQRLANVLPVSPSKRSLSKGTCWKISESSPGTQVVAGVVGCSGVNPYLIQPPYESLLEYFGALFDISRPSPIVQQFEPLGTVQPQLFFLTRNLFISLRLCASGTFLCQGIPRDTFYLNGLSFVGLYRTKEHRIHCVTL